MLRVSQGLNQLSHLRKTILQTRSPNSNTKQRIETLMSTCHSNLKSVYLKKTLTNLTPPSNIPHTKKLLLLHDQTRLHNKNPQQESTSKPLPQYPSRLPTPPTQQLNHNITNPAGREGRWLLPMVSSQRANVLCSAVLSGGCLDRDWYLGLQGNGLTWSSGVEV
ncbi:hypothetical protein DM02DRAFT_148702 [Periconia macrospinosa]|uniref:Uncharacterized protein n=1 Tax=Periconia macrospinosa TaxID=97972 RepID=A0A2V1DE78_9PLEO|nr:hypothetical protein DM02DRAFT_148702 [Periconia macrospinosa]